MSAGTLYLMKNDMSAPVTAPPAGFRDRLEYWSAITGEQPGECAHEVCHRKATEGALARMAFSTDRRQFIFPACETCARRTEMLYVKGPLAVVK